MMEGMGLAGLRPGLKDFDQDWEGNGIAPYHSLRSVWDRFMSMQKNEVRNALD
jgi:hypothetical protein